MNYDLTEKKDIFCVVHKKEHFSEGGWAYRNWETEEGTITGWGCADVRYPEMVPQRFHEERVKFANDMLQSHRGAELSREFLEAHPARAKKMLKDGAITKDEVKNSKYVWKGDVKGVTKKVDAEVLIK